jgi:hypothetical protein
MLTVDTVLLHHQAPKLPNAADMSIAKRLFKKYNHSSNVCIGLPGNKDPQQFKVSTSVTRRNTPCTVGCLCGCQHAMLRYTLQG